jgi:hypothetical protein
MTEISFEKIRDEIFSAWRQGKALPVDLERFDFLRLLESLRTAAQQVKCESFNVSALKTMSTESFREAFVNNLDVLIRDFICRGVYPAIDEESEREALALSIVRGVKAVLPTPLNQVIELIEPLLLLLVCGAIEFIVLEGIEKYCSAQPSAEPALFKVGECGTCPEKT